MLAPNKRSLLVEALVPPLGFELRDAIASTYSLSLDTLLGIPLHLALAERAIPSDLNAAALAILGALRRLSGRITVFSQAGRTGMPAQPHALYALLEPVIVEVNAAQGACHAKLWVLRFDAPDGARRIRLIVPTRNITADRSWDASLVLEGQVAGGPKALNAPLAKLLTSLPGLALQPASDRVTSRVAEIAEDVRRVEWERPGDWDVVAFHVLGLGRAPLPIESSDELLVVSPFVTAGALDALARTTKRPRALVSRPEELAKLSPQARGRFEQLLVLAEAAGADPDGLDEIENRLRGLHAKVYVATTRSTTDLWIGSANATNAGLSDPRNVEILVQLRTKGKARPIDEFLAEDGMGGLLEPFDPATEAEVETEATQRLEFALEALAAAPLVLRATREDPVPGDDNGTTWRLVLETATPIGLPAEVAVRAWPVSTAMTAATDLAPLRDGHAVPVIATDASMLTGLLAFELRDGDEAVCFVRNLPILDLPPGREADLLHAVIGDRERFLALMLALFGDGSHAFGPLQGTTHATGTGGWSASGADGAGLLEHLVRACARDRARLREAASLVASLRASERGAALVPEGFPELLALLEEVAP